jgi:hypothetical protein
MIRGIFFAQSLDNAPNTWDTMNTLRRAMILAAAFVFLACQSQDDMDKAQLLRHFDIPPGTQIIEYHGYPDRVGFGQREGLQVSATYRFTESELAAWLPQARSNGWQPLPIPPEIRQKIPYKGLKVDIDAAQGLYLCRTAGDNVLHAKKTRSCAEVQRMNDIIIGTLDPVSRQLRVTVRSSY